MPKSQKEAYFTPDSIGKKSLELQRWLKPYLKKNAIELNPQQSALLLLDLQAYFLEETNHAYIPSSAAIIPGINSLLQAYTRLELVTILSRHLNTPQDAGLMASWWHDLIVDENPNSKIDRRINRSPGIVIKKSRYDAFYDTPLESILREKGVEQIVICGVMTHLCCETTARSAFMRGFEVFFTIDGTATYNEAFHRAALLNLAHGFARPVLVTEILAALEGDNER